MTTTATKTAPELAADVIVAYFNRTGRHAARMDWDRGTILATSFDGAMAIIREVHENFNFVDDADPINVTELTIKRDNTRLGPCTTVFFTAVWAQ